MLFEVKLSEFLDHTNPVQGLVSRKFPVMLGAITLLLHVPLLKSTEAMRLGWLCAGAILQEILWWRDTFWSQILILM